MSQLEEDREDDELDQFFTALLGSVIDSVSDGLDTIDIIRPYPGPEFYSDESEFPEGF